MTGKRKVHTRTDLHQPRIAQHHEGGLLKLGDDDRKPPAATLVNFGFNAVGARTYDFATHYAVGIDEITSACQRQIERFLCKQDAELEVSTIAGYARSGLDTFLPYLALRAAALRRALTLADIDRDVIDGYLRHLADSGATRSAQKMRYDKTKAVIQALGRRRLIHLFDAGTERTFPANPFPNSARQVKGETPLLRKERQAFAAAVKTAVMPIFREDVSVTSELLSYALLIIALHTGRNTTPLLEMGADCLRPHPKENTEFLVLWKRRGYNSSKVALRADGQDDRTIESMPGVKVPIVRLIRRVIELSKLLQAEAEAHHSGRIWLYRSRQRGRSGYVTALNDSTVSNAIQTLVADAGLVGADGKPLRINVSRLRKTFANRIFELLDGDLGSTAVALGSTPRVAGRNYMRPGERSSRNWQFMGEVLTQELLSRTIGATERTPTGRCTDPSNTKYSSTTADGAVCFSFLDCLRCRNYVVTGEDLYRLFSFYWRVLRERDRMDARIWERHYAHIPRLIERDVIATGLQRKVFKPADVDAARERARHDPHAFWRFDSIASLDDFRQPLEETA